MNRDFNFFSPYIEVKRSSKANRRHMFMSICLLLGIFAGFLVWNLYTINSLKTEISKNEKFLSSPQVKQSLKEYEELRAHIDELGKYYDGISKINDEIDKRDIIKTDLLDNIAKAIPVELFLQGVATSEENISLVCTASNKTAVAEFERNLKQVDDFAAVHVASTKKLDNYFISTIKIKIKEVADIEAD